MPAFLKSKTQLAQLFTLIAGGLAMVGINFSSELQTIVLGVIVGVMPLVNIIIRYFTTEPMSAKRKPARGGIPRSLPIVLLAVVFMAASLSSCKFFAEVDDAPLYTACRAVVETEQLLRPFKPKMTEAQVITVGLAIRGARIICLKPVQDIKDLGAAAKLVSGYIENLSKVKKELSI